MSLIGRSTGKLPIFLVPAFAEASIAQASASRCFSTSACNQARSRTKRRGNRDSNKQRGVSAIRSTGPRQRLSIDKHYKELPRPRAESERPQLEGYEINQNHGLYGFFNKDRDTVLTPEVEEIHGRAWTYHDLCFKHFEDLHSLYWQCILELNRIRTRNVELRRLRLGYGNSESHNRYMTVQETMRQIRRVLVSRQNAYEEAKLLVERKGYKQLDEEMELDRMPRAKLAESHPTTIGEEQLEPNFDTASDNQSRPTTSIIPESAIEGGTGPVKAQDQSKTTPTSVS